MRLYFSGKIDDLIQLNKKQTHYVTRVMRLKINDHLRIFNEKDGEWNMQIKKINKNYIDLEKVSSISSLPICVPIHLFFAPIKHEGMNFIIQKGTELGVTNFHPVLMEYSNTYRINKDRLQKYAIEAAEQCERIDVPYIHDLKKIKDLSFSNIKLFVCIERLQTKSLKDFDFSTITYPGFFIGPEGGISQNDLNTLQSKTSFQSISLGKKILRSETACIAALAVSQIE